jgi:hypothetical protein
MTLIRPTSPLAASFSRPSVPSTDPTAASRSPVGVGSAPAAATAGTTAVDTFERIPARRGTLIAVQPLGAMAALLLNAAALSTGVTNTMTGWDRLRGPNHNAVPRRELVHRPPGGA